MVQSVQRGDGNGHIPFGTGLYLHKQASRMTHTTSRKLTYWISTNVITPHVHRRNGGPSIYSYTDLLAVRAVERLRSLGLPLQRMRKAVDYLYNVLGSGTEWWNLKMVVDDKDLIVILPRDQSPSGYDETVIASRGGQKPLELIFADLVNDLFAGGRLGDFPNLKEHISIDANIQGGAPVIKNSRIKTSVIYMWAQRGMTASQIAELYDNVDSNAVNAAIQYEQALAEKNGDANATM